MMESPAQPRVTVIIIFFNPGSTFFREAIESVLAQTYSDWELLLIDDGSSDGSEALAREYVAQRPGQIGYLCHEGRANRGMSASRNLGLARARGEFVAMLDADDVWQPTMLAHHVGLLERHPQVALTYGRVESWFSWNPDAEAGSSDFVPTPLGNYDRILLPPELLRYILERPGGVPLGALMRRNEILALGGYVDSFRGMCEDMAFFSKVAIHTKVYVSSECLYRYRQHNNSCVVRSLVAGQRVKSRRIFLAWLSDYLRKSGIQDPDVQQALRRQVWIFRRQAFGAAIRSPMRALARRWSAMKASASTTRGVLSSG